MIQTLSQNRTIVYTTMLLFLISLVGPLFFAPEVKAAKFDDGTWTQSATPGTTTVEFVTTGGLDQDDEILLTFPAQADVDATGSNITVSCSTSGAQSNVTRDEN